MTWSGLWLVLVTTAIGWIALWPSRRHLDALAYHLYAFPIGLLVWTVVAASTTLFGWSFRASAVAAGVGLFLAFVVGSQWTRGSTEGTAAPRWWTWLAAAGALSIVCAVVIVEGYTIGGFDSIVHYEGGGLWIYDSGRLSIRIMAQWAPLLPSMHAVDRLLGGDWGYVPYPVFAVHVLALLGLVLYRFGLSRLAKTPRAWLTGLAVLVLATRPPFEFHTLAVQSQMVSAMYLLGALVALRHASENAPGRSGWVVLSALMTVGLALARPDGLAYAFVPFTVAGILALQGRWSLGERLRYGVLLWVLVAFPYLATLSRFGTWTSRTLSSTTALVVLGALLGAAVVLVVFPMWKRVAAWLADRALSVPVLIALLALFGVVVRFEAEAVAATFGNLVGNLFYTGDYGYLTYVLAAGVIVTLAFPKLRRAADFSDLLGLALIEFFAIGLLVYTFEHVGRLDPADSFNRVAFHTFPLFVWYLAAFAGAALHVLWAWWRPPSAAGSAASDPDRRRAAFQSLVALGVLLLLLLPLGANALRAREGYWSPAKAIQADGQLTRMLAGQQPDRLISVSIGLAARWAAGGVPNLVVLPKDSFELLEPSPDLSDPIEVPGMQPNLTGLMTQGRVVLHDYDPRVRDDVFEALLQKNEVEEFPFHVYAVRRPGSPRPDATAGATAFHVAPGDRRLMAVADDGGERIAIIPAQLNPIDTCPPADIAPECPEPDPSP